MPDGIFDHAVIFPVKPFVSTGINRIKVLRNSIKVIVQKFIHHKDGSVRDIGWPFVDMIEKRFNNFLCSNDPFYIRMRFGKKSEQPGSTTSRSGKIQFMENGEFLFRVKDRNIAQCSPVNVHRNLLLVKFLESKKQKPNKSKICFV